MLVEGSYDTFLVAKVFLLVDQLGEELQVLGSGKGSGKGFKMFLPFSGSSYSSHCFNILFAFPPLALSVYGNEITP